MVAPPTPGVSGQAPDQPTADSAVAQQSFALPAFDLVRVEPGGLALVAGTGEPGGLVEVLVDGDAAADTTVGRDGTFVTFIDIPGGGEAKLLTLRLTLGEAVLMSAEDVVLAPRAPVVATADETTVTPTDATDTADQATETATVAPDTATVVAEDDAAPAQDQDIAANAAEPTPSEDAAPVALLSTAAGVTLLDAAPLAPGEVALDTIGYDAAGAVEVAGRGGGAGFVRIYLDNAPITTSRIEDSGRWAVTLPEVDEGTYTLRVDQVAEDGTVIARVESPFLRESPETLAEASDGLDAPLARITVQPGNTLWGISRDRYGEGIAYVRVFDANRDRIRDPDLIYPGQIFDLPDN